MKIKCKLVRPGGTVVTLGNTNYHFTGKGPEDMEHVCEVSNKEHIARLLAIPDAYEIADAPKTKKADKTEPPKTDLETGGDNDGTGDADGGTEGDGKDPE